MIEEKRTTATMLRLAARASTARLLATRLDLTANVCHGVRLKPSSMLESLHPVDRTNENRYFSSTTNSSKKNWGKAPLINEQLISHLIRQHKAISAHEVDVRLVVTSAQGESSSSVVSLMNAVEICTDLGVDLVGINIEQNPPIIKAQDMGKLVYRAEKRSTNKSNAKPMKLFTIKASIADNDFTRKLDSIIDYLQKGHNCQVTIKANAFTRRNDTNALMGMMDRMLKAINNFGTPGAIKSNEDLSGASVLVRGIMKK